MIVKPDALLALYLLNFNAQVRKTALHTHTAVKNSIRPKSAKLSCHWISRNECKQYWGRSYKTSSKQSKNLIRQVFKAADSGKQHRHPGSVEGCRLAEALHANQCQRSMVKTFPEQPWPFCIPAIRHWAVARACIPAICCQAVARACIPAMSGVVPAGRVSYSTWL